MRRAPLRRTSMRRTSGGDTGPSPLQRAQVIGRAHGYCERCGASCHYSPFSIHHRLPRGRGGQNTLSNLVLLCGSATTPEGCHQAVESRREQAYDGGWLVRSQMDAAEVPVNIIGRGPTLLADDGTYAEVGRV